MSGGRSLTASEIALARGMFGGAIDYTRVRLHNRKWAFFQPRNIVMAPMGHIHFHPDGPHYCGDFCSRDVDAQGLFIHEMTHVWQTQQRGRWWLPLMRHPFCSYTYRFTPGQPLERYGIEQQAEIVRHVFMARQGRPVHGAPDVRDLERVLPFR